MWKPVIGLEGRFEVSSTGEVRRLAHVGRGRYGASRYPAKTVKPTFYTNKAGYTSVVVSLPYDGGRRTVSIANLVAEAFLGSRPIGAEVCHDDGDTLSNRVDNLRYDSHAGNMSDTVRHGTSNRGLRHPLRKLSEQDVLAIRARLPDCRRGDRARLASEYGVSPQTISSIGSGANWGWLNAHHV